MQTANQCYFCGQSGQMLFSTEKQCFVHSQCIVVQLTAGDPMALAIAKEFDMVSDSSECSVGCDECVNRWCGR